MRGADPAGADWQRRLDAAAPGLVERCTLVGRRPRSVILRGQSPAFGDVCIKCDPRPEGRARLQAEYDALGAYHSLAGRTGPFGVPEPIALLPDSQGGAALVTRWISCPRADDRLSGRLPFLPDRAEVLRRAAEWLAHFHRLGEAGEKPLDTVLDLTALEARLLAALGAARRDGRDPARDALAEALGRGAGIPVRTATVHDDFLPQNLFLCDHRTIGIDFTLHVTGPALSDVGEFLANIVWRGYSTLDPRRSARFAGDARAFLDAYYGGAAVPERRAAQLFVLAALARKAEALSAKIGTRRFGTSDRVHRRMVVGAIRALLCSDPGQAGAPFL